MSYRVPGPTTRSWLVQASRVCPAATLPRIDFGRIVDTAVAGIAQTIARAVKLAQIGRRGAVIERVEDGVVIVVGVADVAEAVAVGVG